MICGNGITSQQALVNNFTRQIYHSDLLKLFIVKIFSNQIDQYFYSTDTVLQELPK